MLLLLCSVLQFRLVKLGVLSLDLLLNQARVPNSDVMISTPWDLLAQVLEALGRSAKLSDLLNLETFRLFFHVLKENAQVSWNAIVAFEILDIFPLVELLAKLFAHGFDTYDSFREFNVGLTCIIESNWSQNFEFLILTFQVSFLFLLLDIDAFPIFAI